MKKYLFILCTIILGVNLSFAQETGKWRGGLEGGFLYPVEGSIGILGAAEVKYNIQKNMNVGLKTEVTSYMLNKSQSGKLLSFSFTYDYYLHYANRKFSPFVGGGLGYFFCKINDFVYVDDSHEYEVDRKINNPTVFIRTGFEVWKFRTTLACNLARKPSEKHIEMRINDYISLSIGFYLGGGKWKK